ncbi:SET and MYND domain-containing protein 4-like [Contarinia nasturtii]|uniref:SET and MYND domain-containing protein 4-like n=1 Tax=Contarinia nasturtii TaxID=265458 RepID=UPI0012D49F5B|nr:SET and MYND domain-containing protein 4-like [Contarinia nasturtii]
MWKKESDNASALFVDLFACEKYDDGKMFEEWDRKIRNSDWEHNYPYMKRAAVKSDKTSDFYLAQGDSYRKCCFDANARVKPGLYATIQLYNQCLCFAEIGSKNVGFAYANRAICFLHCGKHSECFKDIELAIAANHPPELLPDLMKLKQECEGNLEKFKKMNNRSCHTQSYGKRVIDPQLSFSPHEKFPCMANVLEIQENEEFGRHVVATCDIAVGQTVLVEENYVSQSSKSFNLVHCGTCLQYSGSLFPCSKCTDVMFCSETCQNQNELHHKFCGANFERMPSHIRFIIRSMLIGIIAFTSAEEMMEFVENTLAKRTTQVPEAANDEKSKYALFLNLKGPRGDKFDVETTYKVYTGLLDIALIKSMFDSQQSQRFLMHFAAEHVSIISSLIVARNSNFNPLACRPTIRAIPNVFSLFNHSCAANLLNLSFGNSEVCITIRPIKKGDQLFVKYLDAGIQSKPRSRRRRQDALLKYWGFLCKCDKCEPNCKPKQRAKMKSDENYQFLSKARCNYYKGICDRTELSSKCIAFLEKFGHLPWSEEMNLVLDVYTKCLLDDYANLYNFC